MKKIKGITVKMTFRVGLGDVNISDSIAKGLDKIADMGDISDGEVNMTSDRKIIDAYEWLNSNIESGDAFSWEYEIEDLELEDI